MKFRRDFVTNSSSSSFVCEICGRVESGFEIGLAESGMMECVNGHIFCEEESLEIPPKEELLKMILENEWNKGVWDSNIRQRRDYTQEEIAVMNGEDLFTKFCSGNGGYYDVPECVCPICQFIEYSDRDLSKYLSKKYGVSKDEVFAEVKKFNKRRKKLYDSEYIAYVCRKYNLNPTEIVAGWKEKFGTYKNFMNWLNKE